MPHVAKKDLLALRAETGAPLLECRKVLAEARGDLERARGLLQARGRLVHSVKASRRTGQGTVGVYVHGGGRTAALVLLRCETDFVARSPVFQALARDLAMQVVALAPSVIRPEETPAGAVAERVALLAQPFVRDESGKRTVADLIAEKVLELGENITVERFERLAV